MSELLNTKKEILDVVKAALHPFHTRKAISLDVFKSLAKTAVSDAAIPSTAPIIRREVARLLMASPGFPTSGPEHTAAAALLQSEDSSISESRGSWCTTANFVAFVTARKQVQTGSKVIRLSGFSTAAGDSAEAEAKRTRTAIASALNVPLTSTVAPVASRRDEVAFFPGVVLVEVPASVSLDKLPIAFGNSVVWEETRTTLSVAAIEATSMTMKTRARTTAGSAVEAPSKTPRVDSVKPVVETKDYDLYGDIAPTKAARVETTSSARSVLDRAAFEELKRRQGAVAPQ